MNIKNFEKFHNYLCAVVKYYRTHKSLKNFSNLAREFKVKAITRELFFQFDLDKVEQPSRELSDKIRTLMAEIDMKRRQAQLSAYLSEHAEAEEPEPDKTEFDKFEEHMRQLTDYINAVTGTAYTKQKGVKLKMNEEFCYDRFEDDAFLLRLWASQMEYLAAEDFFGKMDIAVIRDNLLNMGDLTMHAFLSYIFGDEHGVQTKFDFDARGNASADNDSIEESLAEYGVFNDVAFHKLESWKGCGHLCIVYKDAPDVLMVISDSCEDFYTVDDDVFYSYCGDTIIDPGNACAFGGWGTRQIMARCIRAVLTCRDKAVEYQKDVPSRLAGKLLNDLKHTDDIRAMYKEEWKNDWMAKYGG